MGANETFDDGDKVVHGQQGEVGGPATAESHKGKGVKVRFPGNKGWVECCLNEVRRLRTAPAATPTPMRHTRDAAYVRPARAVLPQPGPNCKPLRRRQRWKGATPNLAPLPFGECAQVSRAAPPALPGAAADQEEVAVVGERTFAQRDAECRKRAIDLEAETPRKRGRGASGALEERIVSAQSICTAAIDKRVRKLAQPALDEYMADRIDAAELDRRKAAARDKATAEHAPLTELERASAEYTEAVSARTKAEAAEDAAEAKLEAVLRELERGQPGPSGVKA